MITIFNRKLLFSTNHHETYANIIEGLIAAGIKYTTKSTSETPRHVTARNYPGTERRTYTGLVNDIYVHKKDYEKAKGVIATNHNSIYVK